jgi:hypothetical protein
MRPVSDRLLRTIRGSHKSTSRAKLMTTFQTGVTPTGDDVPVINGDVTSDANANIQSTLDLTTVGEFSQSGALTPYGPEIFVERCVYFGDLTQEWVSLGYFRIELMTSHDPSTGDIRIQAKDRMAAIIESRLPFPKTFPPGALFEDIFDELITDVYPSAVIEYDHTPGTLFIDRTHVAERDRYAFLDELATARGKIFYFDYRGILVVKDPPNPTESVFTVDAGESGVLTDIAYEMSRTQMYNGVVAYGEGTDEIPPASAIAVDNNPDSTTYWYNSGPPAGFGQVPRFFFSSFLTTDEQCTSAATKILQDALGLPYRIDVSHVPNPGLEVRDPIAIVVPGEEIRIQAIQTLRIPLVQSGKMSGTTKEKTNEMIGELQ